MFFKFWDFVETRLFLIFCKYKYYNQLEVRTNSPLRHINFISIIDSIVYYGCRRWGSAPIPYIDTKRAKPTG